MSLRKLSGIRRKQVNAYIKLRKQYLLTHVYCEVCKEVRADQIHHKKGRQGDRLTDERFFLAVCQACHSKIEINRKWAMQEGYSLDRLGI